MSWDSWCDRAIKLKDEQIGSEAGIFCRSSGAQWGVRPATFHVPPDVVLSIAQHIEGTRRDGVKINGEKYMYLRTVETDGHKCALFKCGAHRGLSCGLGNKCVIIGRYSEGMQPGKHSDSVYNLTVDLKNANY